MEYNFQYLLDLYHDNDKENRSLESSHELYKIMNDVDNAINKTESSRLFHIVPIFYSVTLIVGTFIMIYKILM